MFFQASACAFACFSAELEANFQKAETTTAITDWSPSSYCAVFKFTTALFVWANQLDNNNKLYLQEVNSSLRKGGAVGVWSQIRTRYVTKEASRFPSFLRSCFQAVRKLKPSRVREEVALPTQPQVEFMPPTGGKMWSGTHLHIDRTLQTTTSCHDS